MTDAEILHRAMTDDCQMPSTFRVLVAEINRLRDIIERNLRFLALDGDGEIDWPNVGPVFDSYIKGHDKRREDAEAENERLKADMLVAAERILAAHEILGRLAEKRKDAP